MNPQTLHGYIQDAISWYWDYGINRDLEYRLPTTWVTQLYEEENICRSIVKNKGNTKKNIIIWGASQVGKSTLLSYYLDTEDGSDSALEWDGSNTFMYKHNTNNIHKKSFNPFNGGSDGSGCVMRLEMVQSVADPKHPITITLCDRTQLMQIITSGYLWECRLDTDERAEVQLNRQVIDRLLATQQTSNNPVNRNAVELLIQAVETISSLKNSGSHRWKELNKEGVWQEIKSLILSHPALTTNEQAARNFIYQILWDNHSCLNELFTELEQTLQKFSAYSKKPLRCSLAFAAALVNIDSFSREQEEVRDLIANMNIVDQGDYYVLEQAAQNTNSIFPTVEQFASFQALVWELHIPLRVDFLERRSQTICELLSQSVLFDIPGVPRAEKNENIAIDLTQPINNEIKFKQILKRGRTFSIIFRYAKELNIDFILLLAHCNNPISKPMQLSAGIEAMWQAIDPKYQVDLLENPPIPIVMGMTFFGSQYNDACQTIQANNLKPFDFPFIDEEILKKLGNIPRVADIYITTSPWFHSGRIANDYLTEEWKERFTDYLPQSQLVQNRLTTKDSRDSIVKAVFAADGGLEFFITQLTRHIKAAENVQILRDQIIEKQIGQINTVLSLALPQRNDTADYQQAIRELSKCIEKKLEEKVDDNDDLAREISQNLRQLFSFDAKIFEKNLPVFNNQIQVKAYLKRQLTIWAIHPSHQEALNRLGLDVKYQNNLMMALKNSIDIDQAAQWCINSLRVDDSNLKNYAKNYIATYLANTFHPQDDNIQNNQNLNEHVKKLFQQWTNNEEQAESAHAIRIILPVLSVLTRIAAQNFQVGWIEQKGDDEISTLFANWSANYQLEVNHADA